MHYAFLPQSEKKGDSPALRVSESQKTVLLTARCYSALVGKGEKIKLFHRTSWRLAPPPFPLSLVLSFMKTERAELIFTNCNIFVIFVLLSVLQDPALSFCNVNREKKTKKFTTVTTNNKLSFCVCGCARPRVCSVCVVVC